MCARSTESERSVWTTTLFIWMTVWTREQNYIINSLPIRRRTDFRCVARTEQRIVHDTNDKLITIDWNSKQILMMNGIFVYVWWCFAWSWALWSMTLQHSQHSLSSYDSCKTFAANNIPFVALKKNNEYLKLEEYISNDSISISFSSHLCVSVSHSLSSCTALTRLSLASGRSM